MSKDPPYMFYHWGPPFIKGYIDEDFRKGLLERGSRLNSDFRTNLSGHIDNEKVYIKDEDKNYFCENMQKIILDYKKHAEWYLNKPVFKKIELISLWINYMKKGEYNPPHIHTGDISFVIYLEVPEQINEEKIVCADGKYGPGTIYFNYGDPANKHSVNFLNFKPKTGEYFMFPANLLHQVAPFRSDVTRISLSGNFKITEV
tara:strand:- start:11 stop:616 length:606 start_codon:yes stop_codon:yes gene_type:complete